MIQFSISFGEAQLLRPALQENFSRMDAGQAQVLLSIAKRFEMFGIAFAVDETPYAGSIPHSYMRATFSPEFLGLVKAILMGNTIGSDGKSFIVP